MIDEPDWHELYQEAAADGDAILEAFGTDSSADVIASAAELKQARATIEAVHEWDLRGRFEDLDVIITAHTAPEEAHSLRSCARPTRKGSGALKNAPHDINCACGTMMNVEEFFPCDCWKADVL